MDPLTLDALSRRLLDPRRGTLDPPLRAAAEPALDAAAQGLRLSERHGQLRPGRRPTVFLPNLRANILALQAAHRCLVQQAARGSTTSPAGEWLLDNVDLLAAQTHAHQDGLPRGLYRDLPVLAEAPDAGLPRIFAIAWAFVSQQDSAFDEATLVAFLQAYQQPAGRELTLAELWALPTTLRVVLIENLRRLAERVAAEEAAREAAHALCDRGAEASEGEAESAFERMRQRGVGAAFALQVMQRLHDDPDAGTPQGRLGREAVRAALALALPDPESAVLQQQQERLADHQSVAQAVRALQNLARADWRSIVSQLSGLVRVLMRSPGFAAERDDTQDTTLHAVERLARRSRRPESLVAVTLLRLMSRPAADVATGMPAPQHCAGWWITGAGRAELLAQLDLRDAWPLRAWRAVRGAVVPLYLATLLIGTLAGVAAFMHAAAPQPLEPLLWSLLALLAAAPASEVMAALVHRLCSEWAPPRHAPRLAWPQGIPAEHRVLVAMPALLQHLDDIPLLVARLERHYLANREGHAQFALLTDWPDRPAPTAQGDSALLAAAVAAIEQLELRHASAPVATATGAAPRRFLLLHRWRRWSHSEQLWIGWERKRGKLEQLMGLLADPLLQSPFIDLGPCARPLRPTTYVLTLDVDTQLPPGALRELVAVAAHPLNQPVVDVQQGRVVAGHAIFQPRVDVAWPAAGQATPYHSLFAGAWGLDPYNAASSEVYNDLFDEASFCGKGLLHVAAMHAVLGGRLPQDQILSHDLLEGVIARCGGISDVCLLEPAPAHPEVDEARLHRWTRGDWQLGPLLRQPRRYGLNGLGLWKMLDNQRRSLVAPLSWLLLVLAFAGAGLNPWAALALGVAALGTGPLLSALAGLAPSRDDLALRHFWRVAAAELLRALAGMLWQLALWPRMAAMRVHAIALALWRSGVSRQDLLQWTTASAAQAQVASEQHPASARGRARAQLFLQLLAHVLVFGLLAALALVPHTPAPWLLLALCVLWAGTPGWIRWAGRARAPAKPPLTAQERSYLLALARDTWRYFELHVGPGSHDLPPDNVQTQPHTIVAQRTSPTNIGLYLLSLVTARAFGWLALARTLERCEATLDTLEKLPSYRGHVLNWVDTQTLRALPPAYVSTVDSGNLCMHLLAVAAALEENPGQPAPPAERSRAGRAAARCRALAERADFSFLYDNRRRLLHIGWNVVDAKVDAAHYDLLASEARLASLWAIAKGDVGAAHWSALGRPFQAQAGHLGLRSWSGSMFEYLMPALTLVEPVGSVLGFASRMAVHEQRRHGRREGLPWGVSECARAEVDASLAYQYGPQGVPGLALGRMPPDERVVAPYATALAAMLEPRAAIGNLRRLQALGARGNQGFVEALDFTLERSTAAPEPVLVHTVMAHHQGMSLVALAVVLLDGLPRRWGMAEPSLAAVACLLQERVPREVARLVLPALHHSLQPEPLTAAISQPATPPSPPGGCGLPPTQLLSNGRYAVALRPNGAGFSRWGALDVSRRRDDALRDAQGHFIFLRRAGQAVLVSITPNPAGDAAADYACRFVGEQAVYSATWPDLRVQCTVSVGAQDDVELRRIELWNLSPRPLALELMSAFEVCLSAERADEMHPAFANLFVSARWDAASQSLLLARKPRREDEQPVHAAHFLAHADPPLPPALALADRARWRGRLRPADQPLAAFEPADAHTGERPTGLDPAAALSLSVSLPAHGTALLVLGTAAAGDAAALQALVQRAQGLARSGPLRPHFVAALPGAAGAVRTQDHAWLRTLATPLLTLVARPAPRAAPQACDRRALWRHGVSGERPLITVRISQVHGLRLVRALVHGLAWWARGGLVVDLIVLNAEPHSYVMALQHELLALRDRQRATAADAASATPAGAGALHVWQVADLTAEELSTLAQLARLRLHADGRPLAQHVAELVAWHDAAAADRALQDGVPVDESSWPPPAPGLAPAARFDPVSGSCRFETGLTRPTPRPWINVLANAEFGALVSESGAGYTWAGNSRLHQLTPWGNDPLSDMDGERFLLQDLGSGHVWRIGHAAASAQPQQAHQAQTPICRIEHGVGFSRIVQRLNSRAGREAIDVTATWCVAGDAAVKRVEITVHNAGNHALALRLVGVLEWMMGCLRGDRRTVVTSHQSLAGEGRTRSPMPVLMATQHDNHEGRSGSTAFLAAHAHVHVHLHASPSTAAQAAAQGRDAPSHPPGSASDADLVPELDGFPPSGLGELSASAEADDWTCDRRELFDVTGRAVLPDLLTQRSGGGLDPCAVLGLRLSIAPGGTGSAVFVIGHAASPQAALELARAQGPRDAGPVERQARAQWRALLGGVSVSTPDPLFNALMNHWLPYQTVACRLWGRAGFYQAGGAFGFRDQLQDAMALAITAPQLLRGQLLRAGARQFVQGDVQHWWHPGSGAGARTRFSDDLLWLPHATLHYLRVTGERGVLDEVLPFIEGDAVPAQAEDAYYTPRISAQTASLYEHGARAIDRSLAVGSHGLPLMGGGDWNDGMNRVGRQGKGESVWLAWLLCQVVDGYAPIAVQRGEQARALRWREAARGWRLALDEQAWDGQWYRRAFFDDGSALGSHERSECRIDLIAQAWSVLSDAAPQHRQRQAMASAQRLLADERLGLWRLLDPPLVDAQPSAGYIQAYPPGVRENGGQYAHGAVWAIMAQARLGDAQAAWRGWTWLSPAHRSAHPDWGPAYGLEPYAMAADVYAEPPYAGRGGWSWYTGSAAGMHRAGLESICGLEVAGQRVRLRPQLPAHWSHVRVDIRIAGRGHSFTVCAAWAAGPIEQARSQGAVALGVGRWVDAEQAGDGSHHLVTLPQRAAGGSADVAGVATTA